MLIATGQLIAFLLAWLGEGAPQGRLSQVRWSALDFQDFNLVQVLHLQKGDLRGAKLRGMYFRGADLRGFDLRDVDLRGANLSNADLREADLREADLREADLSFGCFARADLRGARLDDSITIGTGFLGALGLDAELHWSAGSSQSRVLRAVPRIGHGGPVNCVAWSPDARLLASGSSDTTVMIWDAASGRRLQTLEGHKNSVLSLVWDPIGSRLASGSSDTTVMIWDVRVRSTAPNSGRSQEFGSFSGVGFERFALGLGLLC